MLEKSYFDKGTHLEESVIYTQESVIYTRFGVNSDSCYGTIIT